MKDLLHHRLAGTTMMPEIPCVCCRYVFLPPPFSQRERGYYCGAPRPPAYRCTVSLACAVMVSTLAMMCTTPVVCGLDTMARAIPPRVLVLVGASAGLLSHPGSTSNVTGTPSTGRPWASCTRTSNAVACENWASPVKGPGPTQMVGLETSREKRYSAPGVGPTSFGAQAVPPNTSTRHVQTRAVRRAIRLSVYCVHHRRRRGNGALSCR